MELDHIALHWTRFRDEVRVVWSDLTEAHLDRIRGDRECLVAAVEQTYGIERSAAEREVDAWRESLQPLDEFK